MFGSSFYIAHEELPDALYHPVRIFIVKSGIVMGGFVPYLAN